MVKAWQIAMGECVVALSLIHCHQGQHTSYTGAGYCTNFFFFFTLYNYIYVSIDIMEGMEGSVCL